MCQAIPRQVQQVTDGRAEILVNGESAWVSTVELPDLTVGEYILVYAGVAIQRIASGEAEELLSFLESLDDLFPDEEPITPVPR